MASLTVYSTTSDASIGHYHAIYTTCQIAGSGTWLEPATTSMAIGQMLYGASYRIHRSGVFFDTSALPDVCTISAATLSLYGSTYDTTNSEFDITVVSGSDLAEPLVLADYGDLRDDTTSMGTFDTTGFNNSGYNAITLNATGYGSISKTSTTKFALRSSRDISATSPGGTPPDNLYEYVNVKTSDAGSGYQPKLVITYGSYKPVVTTQTCQDVVGATATGRGTITDLGDPNPTAHGHCWATTINPTTSDSVVDNGAKTSTGTFTSALTYLTPGTGFFTRAYATNSIGTSYGANVYFMPPTNPTILPEGGSGGRAGYIWMEGEHFKGFDENAIEETFEDWDNPRILLYLGM